MATSLYLIRYKYPQLKEITFTTQSNYTPLFRFDPYARKFMFIYSVRKLLSY